MTETYYWKCKFCDIVHEADSLEQARVELEAHEKKDHKGKLVGFFGVEYNHGD